MVNQYKKGENFMGIKSSVLQKKKKNGFGLLVFWTMYN